MQVQVDEAGVEILLDEQELGQMTLVIRVASPRSTATRKWAMNHTLPAAALSGQGLLSRQMALATARGLRYSRPWPKAKDCLAAAIRTSSRAARCRPSPAAAPSTAGLPDGQKSVDMAKLHVIVVGGGIAGLTCAIVLARHKSAAVTVVERPLPNAQVRGRMRGV